MNNQYDKTSVSANNSTVSTHKSWPMRSTYWTWTVPGPAPPMTPGCGPGLLSRATWRVRRDSMWPVIQDIQ